MSTKRTTKKAGAAAKKTPKASPATKTPARRGGKKATPAKGAPTSVAGILKLPAIGSKLTRSYTGRDPLPRSFRISRAALRPGRPVTPPAHRRRPLVADPSESMGG